MTALPDFEQGKGPFQRRLTFGPYGLTYVDRGMGTLKERSVLYEELAMDRVVSGANLDIVWLVVSITMAVVTLTLATGAEAGYALAGLVLCGVSCFACWLRSGPYVEIPVLQSGPIRLYGARPDADSVTRLIVDLTQHTKEYAIRKFGPIQGSAPREEQVNRLRWLRDRNYITDDELDQWLKDLDQGAKFRGAGSIGFGSAQL